MEGLFTGHEIKSISQMIKTAFQLMPIKMPFTLLCPKHKKSLDVYCHSHDCIICDHRDHKCDPISDKSVFTKYQQGIEDNLLPTKQRLAFILQQIEAFDQKELVVAENRDNVKDKIQATRDQMIAEYPEAIQQLVSQLRKKTDQGAEEKLRFMSAQKKDAQRTADVLKSCVEYVEGEKRMGSQQQVLA